MQNLQLNMTQKESHMDSSQKYQGTRTGTAIEQMKNRTSKYFFWNMTTGSASKSRMSMTFLFSTTSGCGVRTTQPMCAKKKPLFTSCGSAVVSANL